MGKIMIWTPAAWVFVICLIAVLMLTGTAMGEVSRTGLVGEWHFDGDAKDSSGSGNDGKIYGATFVDGRFGKALSFNGVDNYVNAGSISQITNDSDWSVSFWMNSASVNDYRNPFGANFMEGANNQGPRFEQNSIGDFNIVVGTSPSSYINPRIDSVISGTWYHVVGIKNGNNLKVYLNNIKKIDQGNTLWPPGFRNVNIGRGFCNCPERWFKGIIDEVLIYNRALSADEIKAIYESGQIIITSSISGAEVLIDGISRGTASPTFTVSDIAPGSHTVMCKLSGYADSINQVNLPISSTASVTCTLSQAPGRISITSSPSGADVYLDGVKNGTAPLILNDISPGNHIIWCKKTGYEDLRQNIEVTSGNISNIVCTLAPGAQTTTPTPDSRIQDNSTPGLPSLNVKVTSDQISISPEQTSTITAIVTGKNREYISGASVIFASTLPGKFNPQSGTTDPSGEFTSTFAPSVEGVSTISAMAKKAGFTDGKGDIVVQVGMITTLNTSKQAAITGKVIDAGTDDPIQDVIITVDDKSTTTGSNGDYELSIDVGKHNLSASKSGYKAMTRSVIVPDGGTVLDISLKPASGDTRWFWIVIILILVVVAAGIIYLLYKKKNQRFDEKKKEKVEAKKEERKVGETVAEKKKFCMFCHAPISLDSEYCNKCGKKQDDTKRFCMNCGALMPAVPELCSKCSKMPPSDVDTKTCKNCGEVIPIVAKFCSACGAGQPE